MDATRQVATAMKDAYGCSGISTRQQNEPDGNQTIWHFHQHVIPRYPADALYERPAQKSAADRETRLHYVALIRDALSSTD